jgi:anti-anti-sigma factor
MLNITSENMGEIMVVRCSGRLVRGTTSENLEHAVKRGEHARIILLDLSGLELVDAGGLSALITAHQWTKKRCIQLKLVNPSGIVYDILVRTGLDRALTISSLGEALQILRSQFVGEPRVQHQTVSA